MIKIEKTNIKIPVYDLTVENTSNFFANDILVHNCAEIIEYSDKDTTAVCNLASISLPAFLDGKKKTFNFSKLEDTVKLLVKNLNKIIDVEYYPIESAKKSNLRDRPIGIGIQGLADVFLQKKLSWDSKEALELNSQILETIYYSAVKTSAELAEKTGAYETFKGSPMSQGLFQFDLWNHTPSNRYDWNQLKEFVVKNGVKNSLLLAQMPTASCQIGTNKIIMGDGSHKSLYEIMDDNNIDWKKIEEIDQPLSIGFIKPIVVATNEGNQSSPGIHYNGYKDVYDIEFEDGNVYSFTENHTLLVNNNGIESWKQVKDLSCDDGILNVNKFLSKIKSIKKQKDPKPTWDIDVNKTHSYVLSNGVVSHNTSQIMGNTESFEMITSNLFKRSTLSGEFYQVNKYLVNDLMELNLWNDTMRQKIMALDGSIQSIPEIPDSLKPLYKTVWETSQKIIIDMAAARGPFVCQSQSMNLYFKDANAAKISSALMYAWEKGLKTLVYYTRNTSSMEAVKVSVDKSIENSVKVQEDISCSIDNPDDCIACGS